MEEGNMDLNLVKQEMSPLLLEVDGHGLVCINNDQIYEITRLDGTKIQFSGLIPDDGRVSFVTVSPDAKEQINVGESQGLINLPDDNQYVLDEDSAVYMSLSDINLAPKKHNQQTNLEIIEGLDVNQLNDLSVINHLNYISVDQNMIKMELNEAANSLETVSGEKQVDDDKSRSVLKTNVNCLNVDGVKDVRNVPRVLKRGRPKKEDKSNHLFKCNNCSVVCQSKDALLTHQKTHNSCKPHVCEICGDSFNIGKNLELHLSLHNVGNLTCPDCNKKFTRFASFKAHLTTHEEEENFFCCECGDEFSNNEQYDRHMVSHKKEWEKKLFNKQDNDKLTCKLCNKIFTNSFTYDTHKREHQKFRKQLIALAPRRKKKRFRDTHLKNGYTCDICSKSFPKPSQLLRHKRIHTGEKPFKCHLCPACFTQKGSLQIHMAKHNGLKPHRCSLCCLKFSQRGNLIAHVNKVHSMPHDGEEVYKCVHCSCVFKRLASLNCHVTRFHLNAKSKETRQEQNEETDVEALLTEIADLRYNTPVTQTDTDILQQAIKNSGLPVDKQVKEVEPTEYDKVAVVTIAERRDDGTIKHYTVKQRREGLVRWHQCFLCVKEFKKPSDLIRHIRIHTREKPYKCELCFRSFSIKSTLQTHLRTHSMSNKLYECKICGRKVSSSSSLTTHYKFHTGVRSYKCDTCNKSFTTAGQLKSHCSTLVHKTKTDKPADNELFNDILLIEPLVLSGGCFKQQLSRKETLLYKSQNASISERPYECDYCHLKFRKSSHVKQHILQHTGQKPYTCYICQKGFITNGVLKMHLKTHLGKKEYGCDKCSSKFSTKGSLKRHHQTLHSDERPYLCPYCSKRFKTSASCRKHIRIHRYDTTQLLAMNMTNTDRVTELLLDAAVREKVTVEQAYQELEPQNDSVADTNKTALQEINQEVLIQDIEQQLLTSTDMVDNTLILNDSKIETEHIDFQGLDMKPLLLSNEVVTQECLDQNVFIQSEELQTVTSMADILPETTQIQEQDLDDCEYKKNLLKDSKKHKCDLCNKTFSTCSMFDIHTKLHLCNRGYTCPLCGWSTNEISVYKDHHCVNEPVASAKFLSSLEQENVMKDSDIKKTKAKLPETSPLAPTVVKEQTSKKGEIRKRIKGPFKEFSEEENELLATQNISNDTSMSEKVLIASAAEKLRMKGQNKSGKEESENGKKTSLGNDCKYCAKSFKKPSDLERHVRIHTGERPFQCTYCNKRFTVKSTLSSHMRTHTGFKPVSCHICEAVFSAKSSLKVHMRLHTGAKPFECGICGQRFRTSGHRKNHMYSHNKNKINTPHSWKKQQLQMLNKLAVALKAESAEPEPLPEPQPSEKNIVIKFNEDQPSEPLQEVTMQNITVTEEFLQQLQEQSIVFTNSGILETDESGLQHIYSDDINTEPGTVRYGIISLENNTNPIQMYVGDSILSDEQIDEVQRQLDMQQQDTILPVDTVAPDKNDGKTCNYCGVSFNKKSQIERHIRVHTGIRPFSCEECGKRFTQSNALETHLKTHRGERPYSCPHCEFTCVQKGNLQIHMKRTHMQNKKSRVRRNNSTARRTVVNNTKNFNISKITSEELHELFPQVT